MPPESTETKQTSPEVGSYAQPVDSETKTSGDSAESTHSQEVPTGEKKKSKKRKGVPLHQRRMVQALGSRKRINYRLYRNNRDIPLG